MIPGIGEKRDIPVVLNRVYFKDDYENDFTTRRLINYTLTFTVKTYLFNEIIRGSRSQIRARVKSWDSDTNILKISNVGIGATQLTFLTGETIIGTESGALYTVQGFDRMDTYDKYSQNDEIEEEADLILDFTESNPFGTY